MANQYEIIKLAKMSGEAQHWCGKCRVCGDETDPYLRARRARYKIQEHLETEHHIKTQARGPRAHVYADGGGIVTGTHDRELAARLFTEECRQAYEDFEGAYKAEDGQLTYGRVIPLGPHHPLRLAEGWTWQWSDYGSMPRRGASRAVVFG